MTNPMEAFTSLLDLDASRVLNAPSLIFLCGGKIDPQDGDEPSLRDLFHKCLKQDHPNLFKQVRLAEEANKWLKAPKHYGDLIELEDDLAYISAVILLFVESEGSIAELGAFCHAPLLRKKLVAVLEHSHQDKPSFILDGPVALLRQHDPDSVFFYPWLGPRDGHGRRPLDANDAHETVNLLLDRLSERMAKLTEEEKFSATDSGHRLRLIADFVNLGGFVRHTEIGYFLTALGLPAASGELNRFLFLLEQLKLIHKTEYGNTIYYVAGPGHVEYVRYALKAEAGTLDRLRLQSILQEETLKPLDPNRYRAFKAYMKKAGQ